ncbi:unnamed protein product, partial [Ectocarpus sp. 6 AP-2014]
SSLTCGVVVCPSAGPTDFFSSRAMSSTSQTPMASAAAPLAAAGSAETDREVLLHFFRSTGGESWTHQEGWAENADDLGSWCGVTSNAEGRVVKLE